MLSTITELNLAGKTDIKHIIMTIKCMITGMRNAVKEVWVPWECLMADLKVGEVKEDFFEEGEAEIGRMHLHMTVWQDAIFTGF